MSPTPVIWSPSSLAHEPNAEVWIGLRTKGDEVPERVTVIRDALEGAGHELQVAAVHPDTVLRAVHSAALVDYLSSVYADWVSAGFPEDPGQDRVVPYFFPTAAMRGPLPAQPARAVHARAGEFAYDTMTVVGPGTNEAARGAVDCALTAVDRVQAGQGSCYALCRPPGHHATREAFGGSCYLNNAAVAAEAFRRAGHNHVAVVDIDAHHGNGTEAIFYARSDVFYGSVHVDPGAGWFPHVVGFAGERGVGDGYGSTSNFPLAPGSGDGEWLAALGTLITEVEQFAPSALVVSLGVDAARDDPESPLEVTMAGYERAGELIGSLSRPTVIVQEGGYNLATLGSLVRAFLRGHDGGDQQVPATGRGNDAQEL
ncbi:MAG TPA: histone deacetylase family protein [Nocardioidaceae bacterium]|nr:histone deacetylase family protein [Nocardioidaceae bacterium]